MPAKVHSKTYNLFGSNCISKRVSVTSPIVSTVIGTPILFGSKDGGNNSGNIVFPFVL
jgi:hypothetical protein